MLIGGVNISSNKFTGINTEDYKNLDNNPFDEDVNLDESYIIVNQLKSAYRKYKTSIYYDNYSAIQRLKLSEFEVNPMINGNEFKIEDIFNKLAEIIRDKEKFNILTDEICKNIEVIAFPKHMLRNKQWDEKIIRNFHEKTFKMDRLYYFIDLPVIGHILGILWILRCGYLLDDKLYKNCYGNRLNTYLLEKLKNKNSDYYKKEYCYDFSPFLFKPYFKNYESWRDNALDSVDDLLNDDKNAIMFSLDLKEYYYRSLIDFKNIRKEIRDTRKFINKSNDYEDLTDINIDNRLTDFVEKVFNSYTSKFNREYNGKSSNKNKEVKNPMTPLGFAPSLIISNWYLQGFDQAILENVRPHYYGRYVDDILIVIGSHEKSESHGNQQIENKKFKELFEKYFTPNKGDPKVNIFYEVKSKNTEENKCSKDEIIYKINNQEFKNVEYHPISFNYELLEIQEKKLKTYYFSCKHSNAMIENFKEEIIKNSSEFRLMHDLESIKKDFKKNLYKIEYKESINKLGDINKIGLNKFEISKMLSRLNWITSDTNDKLEEELIENIIIAFKEKIFEYITLWEKLFTLLLINENYDLLKKLIIQIQKDISKLNIPKQKDISKSEKNFYNYNIKNKRDEDIVKNSLRLFLSSTLTRVFSLKQNSAIRNMIKDITINPNFDFDYYTQISNCLSSSMQNNSMMKYPLEDLTRVIEKNNNKENFDLVKPNNRKIKFFKGFYPRFVKLHEINMHCINNEIFEEKSEDIIKSSFNYYNEINFDNNTNDKQYHVKDKCDSWSENNKHCPLNMYSDKQFKDLKVIKTSGESKDSLKIGLLNTKIDVNYFKSRLLKKPNLKSERFDKIKLLINDAIDKKVDLLVMPEMYIPYEWVERIVKISKDHQMAMIFGVEPVENNEIGNYIMMSLPFIFNGKYRESFLVHRLKNHYAPYELKQYKKYGKKVRFNGKISKYYMCIWRGVHIVPYYCYEIASIEDRGLFKSCCDIVTVSEFNKDTKYFKNIAESLSRDLFAYCVKSNTSEFGGSCIIQPKHSENQFLIDLKGGDDDYIVTQDLNIKELRENALEYDLYSENNDFKPKPPGFWKNNVKRRYKKNKY